VGYVVLNFFMSGLLFSPTVKSVFVGGTRAVSCVQSGLIML